MPVRPGQEERAGQHLTRDPPARISARAAGATTCYGSNVGSSCSNLRLEALHDLLHLGCLCRSGASGQGLPSKAPTSYRQASNPRNPPEASLVPQQFQDASKDSIVCIFQRSPSQHPPKAHPAIPARLCNDAGQHESSPQAAILSRVVCLLRSCTTGGRTRRRPQMCEDSRPLTAVTQGLATAMCRPMVWPSV